MLNNPEAICVILNVYDACQAALSGGVQDALLSTIKAYGTKSFSGAQATLFDHPVLGHLELQVVLTKQWARRRPEEYAEWLESHRRILNTLFSTMNHPVYLRAEPKVGCSVFDFVKLNSFQMQGYHELDISRAQEFIGEVSRFGCLESCDDRGFTLLQSVAVKDDLEMAKILVATLGASVNAYGNTYGWTPLLLSCHCGHFEMAKWLAEHGADPTIRETLYGATILHSLHRFSKREHCEEILDIALSADLDINCAMKNGYTPLHTTFSGWDYSNGAAAELLLEYGADPSRQGDLWGGYFKFISPIALAAQSLDTELPKTMISVAESIVSVIGHGYEKILEVVLSLLADQDMRVVVDEQRPVTERGADPCLVIAITQSRAYFLEAFLNAFPATPVNPNIDGPSRTFLHIAIERWSIEAVRCLLRHGADILVKDVRGRHSVQVAAHCFPTVVPELIEALEGLALAKRRGKSVRDILEDTKSSKYSVFAQLILEGYDDERKLLEFLRVKYDVKHDYKIQDEDGTWSTFLGHAIPIAGAEGLIPVEHIEYLLSLDPLPSFVCSSTGDTLLTSAVQGFCMLEVNACPQLFVKIDPASARGSFNLPCHQITEMILAKYPDHTNLLLGPNGSNALQTAAYWGNGTALQMIKDHMQRKFPRKTVPWNVKANGNTVLDYAMLAVQDQKIKALEPIVNRVATRATRESALACYEFLRENGAVHNWELQGTMVADRFVWFNAELTNIATFIRLATQRLGLDQPELAMDDDVVIATTSSPGARIIRSSVVQLAWRSDKLFIRLYSVKVSNLAAEGLQQFLDWFKKRMTEDDPRLYTSLHIQPGLYPYMTLQYEHYVPGTTETVRRRRGGRIWTEEEVTEARSGFSTLWKMFFGSAEQAFLEQLTGEPSAS
ncbi:hypothetical protein S40288_06979 [Stachybotrys chartarum IBT 40288]|nr:hypothetical protein S40288_06979 [Stachybotrys chartarum IBT 40288]